MFNLHQKIHDSECITQFLPEPFKKIENDAFDLNSLLT